MRKLVIAIIIVTFLAAFSISLLILYPEIPGSTPNTNQNFTCTDDMRNAEGCTAQYDPVCGWFDSKKINCIAYPCAQTYSNQCEACRNGNVEYTTPGICPQ